MILDSLRVYLPKTVHDHGFAPGARAGVGRVVFLRFWRAGGTRRRAVHTAWMPRSCRGNDMGTTSTSYQRECGIHGKNRLSGSVL
jgi:hypothetical protein